MNVLMCAEAEKLTTIINKLKNILSMHDFFYFDRDRSRGSSLLFV